MINAKLLTDIRFWILFFFIVRLYGITNPPLELSHNWRQVAGIMVAKNFFEVDNSIFFPRVDDAGSKSGIVSMEFPLLNYIMYVTYKIFGYSDWYGRLINLIVSSIGIFFFYKLILHLFNKQLAFFSSIVLLCSLYFSFSRKTMPDTFSISLVLIALYYAFIYIDKKKIIHLFLFILFCSLGVLSKIPSAFLIPTVLIPVFLQPIKKNILLILALFVAALPAIYWYFYWDIELRTFFNYSLWNSKQNTLLDGWTQLLSNPNQTIKKFYFEACSFSGFTAFVLGIVYAIKNKNKPLLLALFLLTVTFFLFMLKAGRFFYHHNYYIIPYITVMSLFIGYFLAQLKNKKIAYVLLLLIAIENIANQQHDFRIKKSELYKLSLKTIVENNINSNTKIAVNGGDNPQLLFFSYKKGWSLTNEQIEDEAVISNLKRENCRYLIIDKNLYSKALLYLPLFEDKNFIIYKL